MGTIFGREPVLLLNIVLAVIALGVILWPERITPEVQAGIIGVAIAVISFVARGQVTPVK